MQEIPPFGAVIGCCTPRRTATSQDGEGVCPPEGALNPYPASHTPTPGLQPWVVTAVRFVELPF